ncbi:MAG TPA: hypothetical protein VFU21_03165 [Kofleriaceae bacterium]|nr:hypothetical protein [Kofleriaceae bacterium]
MAPHRDDLEAAHARIAALERELAAARAKARRPLSCTGCHARFQLEDLASGVLTCRGCGAALEIGRPPPARRPRDRPRDLDISATGDRVVVRWRWHRSPIPFTLAIFATVGLVLAASSAVSPERPMLTASAIVCAVLTAAAGYDYVAHLVNRTEIEATGKRVAVRHGPVPYRRSVELARDRIAQLYVEPRHDSGVAFGLVAVETGGACVTLVELDSPAGAFYLEQELERVLGIEDVPVPGEQARS